MTLQDWFKVPEKQEELARLLRDTVLAHAVDFLSQRAKARLPSANVDTTALALTHAHLAGYQKALDDLVTLSQPPPTTKRKPVESEWMHISPFLTQPSTPNA